MRVLIADDEKPARIKMLAMLGKNKEIVEIMEAENGLEALKMLNSKDIDVAFLDINMPGLNGLEVAAQSESEAAIVFTTAYQEYAVEAFEKNATDYLLKPFNEERLAQCLKKLRISSISNTSDNKIQGFGELSGSLKLNAARLAILEGDKYKIINHDDIFCIRIDSKTCTLSTTKKDFISNHKLDYYENLLPDNFFRINRSDIANLNQIKEVIIWFNSRYKLRMQNDMELVVSREKSRVLKDILGL